MKIRAGAQQLIIPLGIFQLVRTLLLPTSFDVVVLIILALIYVGLELEWF